VAKAIAKLQRQAPAMPFPAIQQQVEKELGKPLNQIFSSFETEPLQQPLLVRYIVQYSQMGKPLW
jgi:predicted unusual protein kinase regulating ubiquinone biosynthesis (AarF/ABC1/UbiB family)